MDSDLAELNEIEKEPNGMIKYKHILNIFKIAWRYGKN